MKILIAEDERKVQNFVRQALEQAGMVVDAVSTLSDLQSSLQTTSYDVLVLDRLLNGQDTIHLLPEIRREHARTKVLVLSALADTQEKVRGLTEGADDYLGKPFHVAELVARIRTLSRRAEEWDKKTKETIIVYEDLKIDLESQKAYRSEKRIDLTGKEFRILSLLSKHPGHVFSKAQILDQVWDMNHYPESNVVEVTIANLRTKIDKGFKPFIHSRRGVGYWLGEP